ncbi:family 10 glycosylhydrolase [Botrimarina sp.]|uniref:family 10 glycosylhydrolase n=1 Tax=Botrimarina sp. TaxID=2795802 RepID=UPI0032EDF3FE
MTPSRSLTGARAVFLFGLLLGRSVFAAAPEVRGTWLTTTGTEDHIRSGANTEAVFADLRNIGLNTAYVETWKAGYTNFPSPTLQSLTGRDRAPYLGASRDLVRETVIQAHRNQMHYVGWFEYGFAAEFVGSGGQPFSPLGREARDRGWLLEDQGGQFANSSNGFAWMNPAVPEVRQLLVDITLEAVDRYDLDGVQFDDRLSWPREFGWDDTTAAIYLDETGRSLPQSVDDPHFRAWRQSKVTQFARQWSDAVRGARPELLVSVSPSITAFSDINFNAEWPEWQDEGLFDEYVVQAYRSSDAAFDSILPGQLAPFGTDQRGELVLGLRANGSGAATPYAELEQMIVTSRDVGAAGHSIFYSRGVRDLYGDGLAAFYDVENQGHAANPLFTAPRRAPVVADAAGQNAWLVDVAAAGAYKLVAEVGGVWRELSAGYFPEGERELTVFNATRVELLEDRRAIEPADFNGDGLVNAADYSVWRDTFASVTDLRADANGDGFVNALDYDLWSAGYGYLISQAVSVPEPMSLAVAGLAVACRVAAPARRRRA